MNTAELNKLVEQLNNAGLAELSENYKIYSYNYDCRCRAKEFDDKVAGLAKAVNSSSAWAEEVLAFSREYADKGDILRFATKQDVLQKLCSDSTRLLSEIATRLENQRTESALAWDRKIAALLQEEHTLAWCNRVSDLYLNYKTVEEVIRRKCKQDGAIGQTYEKLEILRKAAALDEAVLSLTKQPFTEELCERIDKVANDYDGSPSDVRKECAKNSVLNDLKGQSVKFRTTAAENIDKDFKRISSLPRGRRNLEQGRSFTAEWEKQPEAFIRYCKIATRAAVSSFVSFLDSEENYLHYEERIVELETVKVRDIIWCDRVDGLWEIAEREKLSACRNFETLKKFKETADYTRLEIECRDYIAALSGGVDSETVFALDEGIGEHTYALHKVIPDFDRLWSACVLVAEYDIQNGVLIRYKRNGNEANIPESVREIGDEAFKDRVMLKKANLPAGLKKIGRLAFCNCYALESVALPYGLEEIGDNAFDGCGALNQMELPVTVRTLGIYAFFNCRLLKSVTLSRQIEKIGDGTFRGCSGLQSVLGGDKVKEIGDMAFADCVSLKEVVFPCIERAVTQDGDPDKLIIAKSHDEAERIRAELRKVIEEAKRKAREEAERLKYEKREAERRRREALEQEKLRQIEEEKRRRAALDKRIDECYRLAERGYSDAQYELAEYYYNGNGVTRSYEDAFIWFEKAAKKGNKSAMERLGDCYYHGFGVAQSYAKAEKWYNKAAKK